MRGKNIKKNVATDGECSVRFNSPLFQKILIRQRVQKRLEVGNFGWGEHRAPVVDMVHERAYVGRWLQSLVVEVQHLVQRLEPPVVHIGRGDGHIAQ